MILGWGIVFSVFGCEGLIRVFVAAVCEFDELGCECGGS